MEHEEGFNHIQVGIIDYHVEKKLMEKLIKMAKRLTDDSDQNGYCINHGKTGSGKTNSSFVEAFTVNTLTKRDKIYLFFRLEEMIEFAKKNRNKTIIWDEPAFTSMAADSNTKLNKNLFRLVNTSRLKRHFVIMNFTKFWRFNVDLVTETAQFFIQMSERKEKKGRFLHIPADNLDSLWNDYKKFDLKNYSKYKTFGGSMPFIYKKWFKEMNVVIEGQENCSYDDYVDLRDRSVEKIGVEEKKKDPYYIKFNELKGKTIEAIDELSKKGFTKKYLLSLFGISYNRAQEWRDKGKKDTFTIEKDDF